MTNSNSEQQLLPQQQQYSNTTEQQKYMACRYKYIPARVRESCRTARKVSGTGMEVIQNSQKFRVGTKNAVTVPRVLWHGLTDIAEVACTGVNVKEVHCTGMDVVQNSQKFWVRVIPAGKHVFGGGSSI